jgi:hypothetical protein
MLQKPEKRRTECAQQLAWEISFSLAEAQVEDLGTRDEQERIKC